MRAPYSAGTRATTLQMARVLELEAEEFMGTALALKDERFWWSGKEVCFKKKTQ